MRCPQERLVRIATQGARSVHSTFEETLAAWEKDATAEGTGMSTAPLRAPPDSGTGRPLKRLAHRAVGGRGGLGAVVPSMGDYVAGILPVRRGEGGMSSDSNDSSVSAGARLQADKHT
jgi:hypothetical protein